MDNPSTFEFTTLLVDPPLARCRTRYGRNHIFSFKKIRNMKNALQEKIHCIMVIMLVLITGNNSFAQKKPNIVIIWGDDVGYWNISAYNQGMMGYKTPNIDRIAKEGALFTDWYGQQSCTAGRAAFITGQVGFRTGLLKVGLPGAKEGLQARDVTIAELL